MVCACCNISNVLLYQGHLFATNLVAIVVVVVFVAAAAAAAVFLFFWLLPAFVCYCLHSPPVITRATFGA